MSAIAADGGSCTSETTGSNEKTVSQGTPAKGAAMPAFEHACRATRGTRSYQEDTALVWPGDEPMAEAPKKPMPKGQIVAVLADGMGGHAGGALASRMACESFIKEFAGGDGKNSRRLVTGLEAANTSIADAVSNNPMLSGMGSTLVAVLFSKEGVEWISVGDSPLLLFRNGEVAALNEDHSLAPELDRLASEGKITAEEAKRDPRRHMLRSAVTGDEIDLVDLSRKPLKIEQGDYVILASDGLHTLENSEIERIITAYGVDGPEAVVNALIRAVEAMRDPHQDNTTVVAVRIAAPAADA